MCNSVPLATSLGDFFSGCSIVARLGSFTRTLSSSVGDPRESRRDDREGRRGTQALLRNDPIGISLPAVTRTSPDDQPPVRFGATSSRCDREVDPHVEMPDGKKETGSCSCYHLQHSACILCRGIVLTSHDTRKPMTGQLIWASLGRLGHRSSDQSVMKVITQLMSRVVQHFKYSFLV